MARYKTEFLGVFYRTIEGNGGRDKSYYIVYKKDGKVCEEQVGRHHADGMSPSMAADLRLSRIKNNRKLPEKAGRAVNREDTSQPKAARSNASGPGSAHLKKPLAKRRKDVIEKKTPVKDFRNPMEITRLMLDHSNDAIYVTQDGVTKFVNKKIEDMTGFSAGELLNQWSFELTHPDDRKVILSRYEKRMRGEDVPNHYPHRIFDRWGNVIWIEVSSVTFSWEGRPAILNFVRDITKRKAAEEALNEMNAALNALLKKRENDIRESEEKMVGNIRELVWPYVMKLKEAHLEHSLAVNVDIIEKHLHEITSPFLPKLSARFTQLSPRETQVATLIKSGMTTKEIARTLNVSTNAVDIYRQKIRKKLGLNREKVNLSSFLSALGNHQVESPPERISGKSLSRRSY